MNHPKKVLESIKSLERRNQYVSTRQINQGTEDTQFLDVVLEGLAEDGGLFVLGEDIPRLTLGMTTVNTSKSCIAV